MTKLHTADEVSAQGLLPYKPRTLMEKARKGELGHVRMGRKVRFTDQHIAEYIAAGDNPLPKSKPSRNPRYAK